MLQRLLFSTTALIFLAGCTMTFSTVISTPSFGLSTAPTIINANTPLSSLNMIDERRGWALSQKSVWKTVNGGKEWMNTTPAEIGTLLLTVPARGISSFRLNGAFPDAQTAWIAAPGLDKVTILHTVDSGQTWQTSKLVVSHPQEVYPVQIRSFTFLDPQTGWLLRSTDIAAGHEFVELYQTQDGAATWRLIAETNEITSSGSITSDGSKTGVSFRDSRNGWLTGSTNGDAIFLYRTKDGGATWGFQQLSVPNGYTAIGGSARSFPPVFFNDKTGVMPVYLGSANPGFNLFFYLTADGGESWLPATPLNSQVNDFIWDWVDPSHGFVAVNGTNNLYATTDGGKKWSAILTEGPNFHQLDFVSPMTGWAISNDGFLSQTLDGGNTWTQMKFQITNSP